MSKELETFREFTKHHPAGLDVNSARTAPPPRPDIECDRADGSGTIAFELVEVVDSALYKNVTDQRRLQEEFRVRYQAMPEASRVGLGSRYQDTALMVFFKEGLSYVKRARSIDRILSYLFHNPRIKAGGRHVPSDQHLRDVLEKVITLETKTVGPKFLVHAAAAIGDPITERLQDKMERAHIYKTSWPIELIAYYDLQIEPPDASWLEPAVEYVERCLSSSRFAAVWIYSRREDKILRRVIKKASSGALQLEVAEEQTPGVL